MADAQVPAAPTDGLAGWVLDLPARFARFALVGRWRIRIITALLCVPLLLAVAKDFNPVTLDPGSAAVYDTLRQQYLTNGRGPTTVGLSAFDGLSDKPFKLLASPISMPMQNFGTHVATDGCLLYTSPSPRDS